MRRPMSVLAKPAVYAGLALGLVVGGATLVLAPTPAVADVVVSNQAAQITVPNATMTDPSQESGQAIANNIYNKELYTIPDNGAPVWQENDAQMGKFTFYYSAKGKNGKTYYSWPAVKNGLNLKTIFDQGNADPNSYELHLLFQNGPYDSYPNLMVELGEKKRLSSILLAILLCAPLLELHMHLALVCYRLRRLN